MTEAEREDVIKEILERELDMFKAAAEDDESPIETSHPETFRLMRLMAHSSHRDDFLNSYLSDLREAERDRRNFMLEKYALMNGLVPALSQSPLLDEIADAETGFLDEAAELYPEIIKNAGSDAFRKYLHAELQSLSPRTLELYAQELRKADEEGRNPVLERHNWLAKKLGKPPLSAPIHNA